MSIIDAGTIDMQLHPALRPGFRLQWEPAQNAFVILYPEGMIKLNQSAGEILKRCEGRMTVTEIVADLESTFATTGLSSDVANMIAMAAGKRWLELKP
jgi:pyrroloquinoline quinone biosynthesis protein D